MLYGLLPRPWPGHQDNPPIGQLRPRRRYLQDALELEEVKVPVVIDLDMVHGVRALDAGNLEMSTSDKIDADVQAALCLVKPDALYQPRHLRPLSGFRHLVGLHRQTRTSIRQRAL